MTGISQKVGKFSEQVWGVSMSVVKETPPGLSCGIGRGAVSDRVRSSGRLQRCLGRTWAAPGPQAGRYGAKRCETMRGHKPRSRDCFPQMSR